MNKGKKGKKVRGESKNQHKNYVYNTAHWKNSIALHSLNHDLELRSSSFTFGKPDASIALRSLNHDFELRSSSFTFGKADASITSYTRKSFPTCRR